MRAPDHTPIKAPFSIDLTILDLQMFLQFFHLTTYDFDTLASSKKKKRKEKKPRNHKPKLLPIDKSEIF